MTRLQKLLDLAGKALHPNLTYVDSEKWREVERGYLRDFSTAANPATIKQLVELVEAMRGALQFYAEPRNHAMQLEYVDGHPVAQSGTNIDHDQGRMADEALRLYDAFNQEGDAG